MKLFNAQFRAVGEGDIAFGITGIAPLAESSGVAAHWLQLRRLLQPGFFHPLRDASPP